MSSIILKTTKRPTSVSRAKIREAVSAVYSTPKSALKKSGVVVRITKKASPKVSVKVS